MVNQNLEKIVLVNSCMASSGLNMLYLKECTVALNVSRNIHLKRAMY